jgi:hypothetical protein
MDTIIKFYGATELDREQNEDPSVLIVEESLSLELSCNFVDRNHTDMVNLIRYYASNNNFLSLHTYQKNYESEELCIEISLSIVNYIASVVALLEHTDKLHAKLHRLESKPIKDFDKKLDEFDRDGKLKFVKKLRNYVSHYKSIFVRTQMTMDTEKGFSIGVILHRDKLLEWDEWGAKAKKYLMSADESINILQVLVDFQEKLREFIHWFRDEQKKNLSAEWLIFNNYLKLKNVETADKLTKILHKLIATEEKISIRTFEDEIGAVMPYGIWKTVNSQSKTIEERFNLILKIIVKFGANETIVNEMGNTLRRFITELSETNN